MGLILSGDDALKAKVLPSIASGEAMASYALSEREAGSDAASMKTRARKDGNTWVINGSKCWITNGGKSSWYTVMAVTDPDKGANGISAFMVHEDDPGFTVGPLGALRLGIKQPDRRTVLRELHDPRRPHHRRRGHRLQDRAGHARPHASDDRCAGGGCRTGRPRRGDCLRQGPQAVR